MPEISVSKASHRHKNVFTVSVCSYSEKLRVKNFYLTKNTSSCHYKDKLSNIVRRKWALLIARITPNAAVSVGGRFLLNQVGYEFCTGFKGIFRAKEANCRYGANT